MNKKNYLKMIADYQRINKLVIIYSKNDPLLPLLRRKSNIAKHIYI